MRQFVQLCLPAILAVSVLILLQWAHLQFYAFTEHKTGQDWQQAHGFRTLAPFENEGMQDDDFIDFAAIESQLWKMQTDRLGQPVLNHSARTQLENIVQLLPQSLNDSQRTKLAKIITNAVSAHDEAMFVDLVLSYYALSRALDKEHNHALTPEQKHRLREKFLGTTWTNRLFGQQHALYRFIEQRREIMNSKTLTAEQKQTRLDTLNETFRSDGLNSDKSLTN